MSRPATSTHPDGGPDHAAGDLEHRRLARARRPRDHHDLAATHGQLDLLEDVQDPLRLVVELLDLVEPQDRFSGTHVRNASPGSVLITFRIESSELRAEQNAVVPTPASTSCRVTTVEMVGPGQEPQGHVQAQPGEAAADEEHDDDLEHQDRDDLGARGAQSFHACEYRQFIHR